MANAIRQPCDEGIIRSQAVESACAPDVAPWVLAATILGSSMAFIDETALPVALPAIQSSLDATAVDAQWVVAAYTPFLASLVLVGGSLGDHFGRRRMFLVGVTLFATASAGCGLSQGPELLIAARAIQGVGAALLVPNSLAIIGASFKEERRGKAIGTWTSLTSVTLILGPLLGGYFAENISWRAVFFINVPLAVAVLAITRSRVPESRDPDARRLDFPGALLATAGLGGIVFGLLESSRSGLGDPLVLGALIAGAVALGAFLVVERRGREPMMPLSLFRSRNFTAANIFTLLLYFALYGTLFFLPFDLIWVHGYSATAAGAAIVPTFLLMSVLSRYTGALTDRFGARLTLVLGPAITALSFALFVVPGVERGSYWTNFFPATILLGVGLSILVPALTTVALNSVEVRYEGLASAINNAFSQTAGLLAVAVLGIIMFVSFDVSLDARLAQLKPAARGGAAVGGTEGEVGGRASTGGSRRSPECERGACHRRGLRHRLPGVDAGGRSDGAGQRTQRRAPARRQETRGRPMIPEGDHRMHDIDLIDIQELKAKLDRGDSFKVVMTLGEWEYRTTHIPGSTRVSTIHEALEGLDPKDEIVLYDSGPPCTASRMAFKVLRAHGYDRLRCYAGGLEEWADAGYPLEGDSVEEYSP